MGHLKYATFVSHGQYHGNRVMKYHGCVANLTPRCPAVIRKLVNFMYFFRVFYSPLEEYSDIGRREVDAKELTDSTPSFDYKIHPSRGE